MLKKLASFSLKPEIKIIREVNAMEKILEQILDRLTSVDENIGTLKGDVSTLKGDVSTLKSDVSTLKNDMAKSNRKLDAVFEQTAELLEFRTDITQKLNKIMEDHISLQQIVGEHEVAIRSIRRSSF